MPLQTSIDPHNRRQRGPVAADADINDVIDLSAETPLYVTLRRWCELTGMSMSGTYRALAADHLIAIKCGGRTLLDARHGLAWLASRPRAEFRAPATKAA